MTGTRVAVVVGASRGVGLHVAEALEAEGYVVARVSRSEHRFRADVARWEDVLRLQDEVETELGTPSVLVNSAGVFGPIAPVRETDPGEWVETLMVNTVGPYLTCRAFVGGMIDAGFGRVVNVSSAAALHSPGALNSAYGTSKVALNHFTRHLAAGLEGTGVTANVIHPGDVKTEMWADIRERARGVGATEFLDWAEWVEETGGDPPGKAAKLVLDIVRSDVNGRFLWIDDPLQTPIPAWGDEAAVLPWRS